MFNAKEVTNFLSEPESRLLVKAGEIIDCWDKNDHEFWSNRVVSPTVLINNGYGREAEIIMDSIRRAKVLIQNSYGLDSEIYPDTATLVRWFPGMEQPPHADDMIDAMVDGFAHRKFGSIIYLNDNYEGGNTYYPKYNYEVKPQVGKLAVHPGDSEHLHGVSKIEGGIRYTVAAFWTFERNRALDWSIS
jgi:hypothetical protein